MGNDGGSIPTRRELVKEGAKDLTTTQVKEIQAERQEHFWTYCALSHARLSQPIVSDGLGTLYNKAAVLDHLLNLAQQDDEAAALAKKGEAFKDRLKSLKDVVEVKFHSAGAQGITEWTCPVTSKRLGPGTKAIYLVPCGHAFAESVVKEMQSETCLQCSEAYTAENVISILPTAESEKDRLSERLQKLKAEGLSHSLKKASGSKKKKRKAAAEESEAIAGLVVHAGDTKANGHSNDHFVNIKNADTASLTARVLAEQNMRNKKRKADGNENVQSLFSSGEKGTGKNNDFMSRGFSIPAGAKR